MILSHRSTLDPTVKQREQLARACGVARFAYNWALAEWKRQYEAGEKPTAYKLDALFNSIKRAQFPFVCEVASRASQNAILDLGTAFSNFFRRVKNGEKPGYPRFKKRGVHDAFLINNQDFRFIGKKVKLPKLGLVKCHEELRFNGKIMSATISREADRWFISVAVDLGSVEATLRLEGSKVGVDLGLITFATAFDGSVVEKIAAPKPLKASLRKLQRLSRVRSRRFCKTVKQQSKRYYKAKLRVAKQHVRIKNIRSDFLHKLTTRLARTTKTIVIEDLNVKGMLSNHCLARSIADVSFYEFRRQLTYKAKLYGSDLVVADRWFPSTKRCSHCGTVRDSISLDERVFHCSSCGFSICRDENAARNLRTVSSTGIYARRQEGSDDGSNVIVKPCLVEARTTPRMLKVTLAGTK